MRLADLAWRRNANATTELLEVLRSESVDLSVLEHTLSDHWMSQRPKNWQLARRCNVEERQNYCYVSSKIANALSQDSSEEFIDSMSLVCKTVLNVKEAPLRDRSVAIECNADGTGVEFPSWKLTPSLLHRLHSNLRSPALTPAVTAVVAMASLLNIHPFIDGNGRCARVLFNAVLHSNSLFTGSYFPLREFWTRSCGGFEIRLREAEIQGRWVPLFKYFTSLFFIAEQATLNTHAANCNSLPTLSNHAIEMR